MGFLEEAQHGYAYTQVDYTSAQTEAVLVTGVSEKAIVVDKVLFSANAAGDMILKSDSSQISHKTYYGINGGIAIDDWRLRCTAGESLKITTTLSGDHSIWVRYYLL